MDTLTRFMEYDGSFDAVFTHRTQPDTTAGTVWRFIMDGNKTIVAIPYQSQHAPAKSVHCVPERIESILCDLEWIVYYVAKMNVNNDVRNWENEIGKAIEAELRKWESTQKLPETAKYKNARTKTHKARDKEWIKNGLAKRIEATGPLSYEGDTPTPEQFEQWKIEGLKPEQIEQRAEEHRQTRVTKRQEISDQAFASLKVIDDSESYKNEQKRIAKCRAQIETKHRKRIEVEKAKRAAEIESETLTELGRALYAHGIKNFGNAKQAAEIEAKAVDDFGRALYAHGGKGKLKALFDFIRKDVCRGNRMNPVIRDVDLRRVLTKVKELTGESITDRVFLAYSAGMKAYVDKWTMETAQAEKIEEAEARRLVLERVRFVAAFEDGTLFPIQAVFRCVHDEKDAELFRLVAPNAAERESINNFHAMQAEMRKTARFQGIAARLADGPDAEEARHAVSVAELTRKTSCWVSDDQKTTFAIGDPNILKSKQLATVLNCNYRSSAHIAMTEIKAKTGGRFWRSTDPHHKGDAGYFVTEAELTAYKQRHAMKS